MDVSAAKGHRLRVPTVLLCGIALAIYGGGYVVARLEHRLVFSGSQVTGPHASRGPPGLTTWELVFFPLAQTEGLVRRALGWTGTC